MTIVESLAVPGDDEPEVDPEFLAQVTRLMPFMIDAAKLAVEEAAATTPTTTYRPAQVEGVDPALRTASVLCDGDTTAITAQVLTELPGQGDRVMVEFRAAGAVFVAGFITSCGTPSGTLAPYAGTISNHAGAVSGTATPGEPPRGWLWCAGQAVSRSTYPALFLAIGETWGAGDGATTFNVPDFRGREFRGLDNMGGSDAGRISAANTLGGTGGTATITTSHMPSHTHSTPSHTHGAGSLATNSTGSHSHNFSSSGYFQGGGGFSYDTAGAGGFALGGGTTDSQGSHSHTMSGSTANDGSGTSGSAGSGSEFLTPYALVHVIIKA